MKRGNFYGRMSETLPENVLSGRLLKFPSFIHVCAAAAESKRDRNTERDREKEIV